MKRKWLLIPVFLVWVASSVYLFSGESCAVNNRCGGNGSLTSPIPERGIHDPRRIVTLAHQRERMVELTNNSRKQYGVAPLKFSPHVSVHAQLHSEAMANAGRLFHSNERQLRRYLRGFHWKMIGENIGVGGTLTSLQAAFMNSPPHRDNLLNPKFTHIGVGVKKNDSGLWLTIIFYG